MIPVLDFSSLIVIILMLLGVSTILICGLLFVRQSIKYSEESRVKWLAFVGLFLIFAAISILLHPVLYILTDSQEYLSYISQGVFIAAMIMLVLYMDRVVYPSSRNIFTIVYIVSEIIFILGVILLHYGVPFLSSGILALIVPLGLVGVGLYMGVLYIKIAIQSQGQARKNAIYVILGGISLAGAYILSGLKPIILAIITGLEGFFLFTAIIAPVLALIGLPLLAKGLDLSL
ncbi:MAG: hypothetical protein HWN66_12490 [Candidatus Helarchaeota archaeon]|nr:hypothetical protein [Candidatus Helarchaeota archaeon]